MVTAMVAIKKLEADRTGKDPPTFPPVCMSAAPQQNLRPLRAILPPKLHPIRSTQT
jgi:hypothetical protein